MRGGKAKDELPEGIHWRVPVLDEIIKYPKSEIAINLEPAAITSVDGKPFVLSANVTYKLTSIKKMYTNLWDVENSLKTMALGKIASSCAVESWEYLATNREDLEQGLLEELNEEFKDFGVQVLRVHLTDLVLAKPMRHYLDNSYK